jgi:hypothetical protein
MLRYPFVKTLLLAFAILVNDSQPQLFIQCTVQRPSGLVLINWSINVPARRAYMTYWDGSQTTWSLPQGPFSAEISKEGISLDYGQVKVVIELPPAIADASGNYTEKGKVEVHGVCRNHTS